MRSIRGPERGSRRTGFFVDLNSSLVAIKPNDFTNEEIFTNMALEGHMVLVRQYPFWDKAQMSFPREECWGEGGLTSSYIAQPIMCSATTTGPETEKTEP